MATIHCKACGRVYNYDKNGTCPKCGAYNRPPRKEIVEADGTVRYVTTENKVCYEEEECYEDEVRQRVDPYDYTEPSEDTEGSDEHVGSKTVAGKLRKKRDDLTKNGQKKSVAVIAIVTALISLVSTIIGDIADRRESAPEPSWEDVEIATHNLNFFAETGKTIPTSSGTVTVNSCQVTGDVLHLDLQCDDINSLTIMGYYETLTDSGYLEMVEAYSSGDLYTYLASLPEGIDAADCAVVLDIPFEDGVNRYWIWLEQPTHELGEAFAYCNQRVYVESWAQTGKKVQVQVCAEDETPVYSEAYLTVLNAAEQPYTVPWYGIQDWDIPFADSKLRFDFTLRNENDTIQSITFRDTAGNQRHVTVNLP